MSRQAAQAMRDLANSLGKEAEAAKEPLAKSILRALADAHNETANAIEERVRELEQGIAPKEGDIRFNPKGTPGR